MLGAGARGVYPASVICIIPFVNIRKHDLHLLLCFDALAATGSVSRAAQRMDMPQPSMSRALARLRETFGDDLFLRTRNGVTPTPKALELIGPVREALSQIDGILNPAPAFDPLTTTAKVTLTSTGYAEAVLMPFVVSRLERGAPGLTLETRVPNREMADLRLERGEIDFRIGGVDQPPEKLRFANLFEDRFVCIARAGHPVVRSKVTLNEFCALPQVRTVIRSHMESADRAVHAYGKRIRYAVTSHDYAAVPHIVSRSNLIATVPERIVDLLMRGVAIRKYDCPVTMPRIAIRLFWHDRTHRSALHKWFRALVVEAAGEMKGD
jgi:DNA-binding transcriptional LysR family regulator